MWSSPLSHCCLKAAGLTAWPLEVPSSTQPLWTPRNKNWGVRTQCEGNVVCTCPVRGPTGKRWNTLEKSGNGLKFSHFPSILYPGSICRGYSSSNFINRVWGGRKLMLCELFSSLTCPRFTDLSSIPFLVSRPLASGTVKSWQALELGLFWLNKQLN